VTKTNNLETPIDYQQLVEVIGDVIVVANTSGAINLWNPAAERLFGFTQAEALGNSLDLIYPRTFARASLGWLRKNHGERGDALQP
jgi:PAS domain S-box-containing protein